MPTAWSAGPHAVKPFIGTGPDGNPRTWLECKCGWMQELSAAQMWDPGERWRLLAAEHLADHPDPLGYGGSIDAHIAEVQRRRDA